jgi:hypothetical protein
MTTAIRRIALGTIGIMAVVCVLLPQHGNKAHAQLDGGSIARLYHVTGTDPVSGDIVSFDRSTQTVHLATTTADAALYGVVVMNPVLVLQTPDGGIPVVSSGEALVNVTTASGAIAPGDLITSSSIPGKGQRSSGGGVVLGTALEGFPQNATSSELKDGVQYQGSIRVLLGIGVAPAQTVEQPDTSAAPVTPLAKTLLKYLLAAVVAVGSVVTAFHNFGAGVRDGIVSVGRNPLAKSSIQSMVILNSILILLVSAAGLFVGFAILLLPL